MGSLPSLVLRFVTGNTGGRVTKSGLTGDIWAIAVEIQNKDIAITIAELTAFLFITRRFLYKMLLYLVPDFSDQNFPRSVATCSTNWKLPEKLRKVDVLISRRSSAQCEY